MNTRDVQEALKNLQQFLLDEYGWDTETPSDQTNQSVTPTGPTSELGAENSQPFFAKSGKSSVTP